MKNKEINQEKAKEILRELSLPFPPNYIKQKPGGKGGSYVEHNVIRERLLMVAGFYEWSIVREIYDRDELGNKKLTGCVGQLTIFIDGVPVTVEGSGDVEHDQGSNGSNLKHAESDSFKRAAINLSLALHLYSGDGFFLYNKLKENNKSDLGGAIDGEAGL